MKNMPKYPPEKFETLVCSTLEEILKLSNLKGGEYSGDADRLANFRQIAGKLESSKEFVWAVYASKHWDAIIQYIKDLTTRVNRVRLESIEGRIDDLLVYLLLLKAMLEENNDRVT